jgi:hypothetical protein
VQRQLTGWLLLYDAAGCTCGRCGAPVLVAFTGKVPTTAVLAAAAAAAAAVAAVALLHNVLLMHDAISRAWICTYISLTEQAPAVCENIVTVRHAKLFISFKISFNSLFSNSFL